MSPTQWMEQLAGSLLLSGNALSMRQLTEVEKTIHKAMENAWEVGNSFDHGFPFNEDMLKKWEESKP